MVKYLVAIIREEGSNGMCEVVVRVVGRARARPAERTHHAARYGGLHTGRVGGAWRGVAASRSMIR